jgi:triacylglycerol lipase
MKAKALLLVGLLSSGMASAATFYNCATNTGCVASAQISVSGNYAQTKFPLVLANGMSGFNTIGPINYWYGIPEDLTRNGSKIFVTKASAFNSSDIRGEQLLQQVADILALTNSGKVNLIGHSHGGQSVRYVAGVAPQWVSSVTSVGTPHKGSPVADLVRGVADADRTTLLAGVVSSIVNGAGTFITFLSGGGNYSQDALAGLDSLTTKGAAAFNSRFPAGLPTTACGAGAAQLNNIRYYSWGGTKTLTNVLDPVEIPLNAASLAFMGEANDGLVGRCSSHFGAVIRDNYGMNHLDEVNQVAGLVNLFETNPKTVFRTQANRLKNAGL